MPGNVNLVLKKSIVGLITFGAFMVAQAANHVVSPENFTGFHPKPLVYGRHVMVVTNNPWASRTASNILKQGGNAVDAAVAAAFVLGLVEPSSSGLGGGGFALTYNKARKQLNAYDGRETAPQSAKPDLFLEKNGQLMDFNKAMLSYRSVGVPAEVALLYKMQRQQGKLTWANVIQPAIDLALKGFPLSPRLHGLLTIDKNTFIKETGVKAIYFSPDGNVKPINALIKNTAYAKSLAIIAKNPREFYTGQIARDIVEKVNKAAGHAIFTMQDLKNYTPVEGHALCSDYRMYTLCSTPFASGGVAFLELMKIYASHYSGKTYSDTNWIFSFLQAAKLAYADRNQYIADPAFVSQPLNAFLSNSYIAQRSRLITKKALVTPVAAGVPEGVDTKYVPGLGPKEHGTTSIAIVDKQGNAVSMTLTVEHQFGSHLFVDGFFLNNELTDFSFFPTNIQGQPVANRVEPLKRPRSSIAPAMVFDKHGHLIAVSGSPGGGQIICYVAKNLIQMLDLNRNPAESSASGNLCSLNDTVDIETGSDLEKYVSELNRRGERVRLSTALRLSGAVNIKRASDGGWYGAADPRREGKAIGE